MMADGEQIHSATYPGSIFGELFSEQTQVNIRQYAVEPACFVVCATAGWMPINERKTSRTLAAGSARSPAAPLPRSRRPMELCWVNPSARAKE
jgi:hypothetical protein